MGAVLLHDSVWVLPANPQTRENFQWLAAEILEQGNEAMIWEARVLLASAPPVSAAHIAQQSRSSQDEELVQRFLAQVDGEYSAILRELEDVEPADLSALARRHQSLQAQDYFHSELGQRVRQALIAAAGGVDP
jgi:hypothetical protein